MTVQKKLLLKKSQILMWRELAHVLRWLHEHHCGLGSLWNEASGLAARGQILTTPVCHRKSLPMHCVTAHIWNLSFTGSKHRSQPRKSLHWSGPRWPVQVGIHQLKHLVLCFAWNVIVQGWTWQHRQLATSTFEVIWWQGGAIDIDIAFLVLSRYLQLAES